MVLRLPSVAEVLLVVGALRAAYPEDDVVLMDVGRIESSLGAARHAVEARATLDEGVGGVAAGVAATLYFTVLNHPLVDGNKKLGVGVAALTAGLNGCRVDEGLLACLALLVARGEAGLDDLIRVLLPRVREDRGVADLSGNVVGLVDAVVERVKPYWNLLRAHDKGLATLEDVCGAYAGLLRLHR